MKCTKRKITVALFFASLVFSAKCCAGVEFPNKNELGLFGIMVHYLPGGSEFKARVNLFDVNKFISDVKDMGVNYIIFPIGQNNGYYNAPNSELIKRCNFLSDRVPDRDLLMELARGLDGSDIKLIVYITFRGPKFDVKIKECLDDSDEYSPPSGKFIEAWSLIVGEWVSRYSLLAAGLWIDGVYNTVGMNDKKDGKLLWSTLCDRLKVGGMNYIGFNPGSSSSVAFEKISPCQSITAGEQNVLPILSNIRVADKLKLHIISYLGGGWGLRTPVRFEKYYLVEYINDLHNYGGSLTLDVGIQDDGGVYDQHKYFVRELTRAIKK